MFNVDKTVCFFGHRKIVVTDVLKSRLRCEIENLITSGMKGFFLFGSKSRFDSLCYEIVSELKNTYPFIQRVYVRAEHEHIEGEGSRVYREYLSERYEGTCYPACVSGAGRAVYIKRNHYMIDKSSVCVVYYDEGYVPSARRRSKHDLSEQLPVSGTEIAYKYAVKKKRKIINVAK